MLDDYSGVQARINKELLTRTYFYTQQSLVESMAQFLLALILKGIELVFFIVFCWVLVGGFYRFFLT